MKNRKGFTLVELLIVVAIIAILVAIAIPVLNGQLEKAREATDLANIRAAYAQLSIDMIEDDTVTEVPPVQLKQKQDGWKIEGNEALSAIGTVDPDHPTPTSGGKCTVSWSDTYNTVLFTFDGEAGGGTTPVSLALPTDKRGQDLLTIANAIGKVMEEYVKDDALKASLDKDGVHHFGPFTSDGDTVVGSELNINKQTNGPWKGGKCYSWENALSKSISPELLASFKDVGNPYIYFDEDYQPISISYYPDLDDKTVYRYYYLDSGTTVEFSTGNANTAINDRQHRAINEEAAKAKGTVIEAP